MDKRLIEKIKALLDHSGRTEAEAMAAIDQAGRLMAKHGISLAEVQAARAEDMRKGGVRGGTGSRKHEVQYVATAVGYFTDTRVWLDQILDGATLDYKTEIKFFGFDGDVMFAEWLIDMLRRTMEREWLNFYQSPSRPRRVKAKELRYSFMSGMAARVSERLRQMKDAQKGETTTGTELVVAKGNVVKREFDKLGMNLRKSSSSRQIRNPEAYQSGARAGDGVQFNKPINRDGSGPLGIGRR